MFRRFYACFEVCRKGWLKPCRPIIMLDSCFLKGLCKGELLVTVGRDGNNKIYLPKCGKVDNNMAETFNGWLLEARLKSIISMLEDIKVAIMNRLHTKK
ncbi:hypothetical protein CFOL_v3_05544, partial [Cephalotus follicularis]